MDFVQYISTPASTTEASPLITTITLTRGRLAGGSVYFPSGPAGKLHLIARMGIHQIIPFNTGQNLRLDNCLLPLSVGIDMVEPPFNIDLITWNDSTDYAHALTICLTLEPPGQGNRDIETLLKQISLAAKKQETTPLPTQHELQP